jgi:ribonuclease HI
VWIKGRNGKTCLCSDFEIILKDYNDLSDNQCEWRALVDAMEYISGIQYSGATIMTDSLLLSKQISGEYRTQNQKLRPFKAEYNRLKNEMSGYAPSIEYVEWRLNVARDYI